MKTSKELFEKLAGDAAFRDNVFDKMGTKRAAGTEDPAMAFAEVAEELGFEVDAEQAVAFIVKLTEDDGLVKVSDDDLDQVAGGYLFYSEDSGLDHDEVIDDETGEVLEQFYANSYDEAWRRANKHGVSTQPLTWEKLNNLRQYGHI